MAPRALIMTTLLLTACGGEDSVDCDPETDRVGTYRATAVESGGTCGPLEDSVVQLDGIATSTISPAGAVRCDAVEPPAVSDDSCGVTTSIVCDTVDGRILEATGHTVQQDSGGSQLAGTISISIWDVSGAVLCSSTYDLVYERL